MTAPAAAWNGSSYVIAWVDPHVSTDVTKGYVYGALVSPAGVVSNVHTLSGDVSKVTVDLYNVPDDRVAVATGNGHAIAAWIGGAYPNYHPTWAILDDKLSGIVAGPFVLPGAVMMHIDSAIHVGNSFYLATSPEAATKVHLHRIDDTTGELLATLTVDTPNDGGFTHLAPLAGGLLVAFRHGEYIRVGPMRADFAGGVALTDIPSGGAGNGGPAVTSIDAKSALVAWSTGNLRAVKLVCSE
jgi:hypothetical protein